MPGNVSGFIGVEGSIRCAGSANRSLSHLEPVSGTLKWKLENGEQRPAPQTHRSMTENLQIAGQRLGRTMPAIGAEPGRQRGGVDAVCVTSALVRTSGLRPSQSAQLSEAIIFLRFRSRTAFAGRWCLSPAAHTGQPCEDTMQQTTSADTASVSPSPSVQY
jgi:hypothetical protein